MPPNYEAAAERLPSADDDICPVCKSSRYLNPNMRFLVNPECYHKMCESCVDRIFSHGPAPCPVAGCHRTLRKQRFRKQTFEDIHVEKEVDIRKRVAKTFNRRAEDFTSLLAYNDYLEEVETVTFNLLNGLDVATTEAKLAAHAAQNAASITRNTQLQRHESASQSAKAEAEKEAARLRRDAARTEEKEARREKHLGKSLVLDQLAHGSKKDAEEIAKRGQSRLKQSSARRQPFSTAAVPDLPEINYTIAGLKSTSPLRETDSSPRNNPYYVPPTPKGQSRYTYFNLPDKSTINLNPWLEKARTDPSITAGGYEVSEYCRRALVEAFSGMAVFIGDESGST